MGAKRKRDWSKTPRFERKDGRPVMITRGWSEWDSDWVETHHYLDEETMLRINEEVKKVVESNANCEPQGSGKDK